MSEANAYPDAACRAVAALLKARRLERGWSIRELERRINSGMPGQISRQTILHFEECVCWTRIDHVLRIAVALEADPTELAAAFAGKTAACAGG